MQQLRSKIALVLTCLILPFYWIRAQYLNRFGTEDKKRNERKRYGDHYVRAKGVKVKIMGHEHLDTLGPCIYLSNHQSHNDIFVLIHALERSFRFVAKKELFQNPLFRCFMILTRSYPLDREDARQSLKCLKQAVVDTENGDSILIFPEGTRSHGPTLLPFKTGLFSVIRKANVPIVPITIVNSFDGASNIIHLDVSAVLLPDEYNRLKAQELAQKIEALMQTQLALFHKAN